MLDTRAPGGHGPLGPPVDVLRVFVRGSNLLAADGAQHADCDIPEAAEAVIVNIAAISPTTGGHLVINADGSFPYPRGTPYSRLNFTAGQNVANEMTVRLCNAAPADFPQVACVFDGLGRFRDFLIWSMAPPGSQVHIVADVVGYLARPD